MTFLRRARRVIFRISPEEVRVHRRGFRTTNSDASARLERIGREFLAGYHAAMDEPSGEALAACLQQIVNDEHRGFAFEGAGMALTLLDRLRLTRSAFADLFAGAGKAHKYMLHVGAGWAFARLPWLRLSLERTTARLDPLLRWLAVDGYGFHEGYFHWPQSIEQRLIPKGVTGYAARAFDQGLGRSLWFVEGIDPERAAARVRAFSSDRQPDLWAGIGLAAAYAGGASRAALMDLRELAGGSAVALAQGAAFAAEARRLAGNLTPGTDEACRVLCGIPAIEAAGIPLAEVRQLPPDGDTPAYEAWRMRIQQRLAHMASNRMLA